MIQKEKMTHEKLFFFFILAFTYSFGAGENMSEGLAPRAVNFQHQSLSDFEHASLQNVTYNQTQKGFQLTSKDSSDYIPEGSVTSPVLTAQFPFNNLILSWDADVPKGTNIVVDAQVKDSTNSWSTWYEMANFSVYDKDDKYERKTGSAGRVVEDELRLKAPLRQFRYRVTLHTKNPAITPTLFLVGVSYADTRNKVPVHDELTIPTDTTAPLPLWVRDLDVPYRTQSALPRDISGAACHPTSLSMVLQYYGTNLPTLEVANDVYDPVNDLFGNWPFNAGFAGSLGYKSYVIRCSSFDPIKQEIAKGYPAIISIAFKTDQLTGAPIHATNGHIIVVRGFTKNGDPICNDPAARNEAKGHVVYKKEELERAWLGHGGATVIVEPRDSK